MGLIDRLKAKYKYRRRKRYLRSIRRKQFNMTISESIVHATEILAADLGVPKYVVVEHLIQIGAYHLIRVIDEPIQRKTLYEHLINCHLLGNGSRDDEPILRMGCDRQQQDTDSDSR